MKESKPRRLHAKVFEVLCKRGRILLSGSANATTAALASNRNVEACVARIQREVMAGWRYSVSEAPELRLVLDEEAEADCEATGVLRAVLQEDRVVGQVLTPPMIGPVSAFQLTTERPEKLGETTLGLDATFSIHAPALEVQSWKGGRLVLQILSADGRRSEGFVSVAAFAEIARRAGAVAPRLLAILAGTETPADVAAIMSWFHEDPRRLLNASAIKIGGDSDKQEKDNLRTRMIAVAELTSSYAAHSNNSGDTEASGAASWRRFMEHVFSAFRETRGPFGRTNDGRKGDDEDDDDSDDTDTDSVDPAVPCSLEVFGKLFELLLSPEDAPRHALMAFDLTQYVCERLQPDLGIAKAWLEQLLDVITRLNPPADRKEDIAAAILVLLACDCEPIAARMARARLLRLGYTLSVEAPSPERAQGFRSVLTQTIAFADAWQQVLKVRTFAEQIRAYLLALETCRPSTDYPDLPKEAPEEWPVLKNALTSQDHRKRILVLDKWSNACPKCHMTLPGIELSKLRTIQVATARNCCDRILLFAGV